MVPPLAALASAHRRCPVGDLWFDLEEHRLFHGTVEIALRPKSCHVLHYLIQHRGCIVPKSELISAIWPDSFVTENSLMQCLTELRRALGWQGRECIKTFSGRGYLLETKSDESSLNETDLSREDASNECQSYPMSPFPARQVEGDARGTLWQQRLRLYLDLCHNAATIGHYEPESPERIHAEQNFWVLYEGPLLVLADEVHVAPLLAEFASALQGGATNEMLRDLARSLAVQCRKSLNLSGAI